MTFREWEPIARRVMGAYPSTQGSPETVLVLFEQLQEFDADIVLVAVQGHIAQSRFFPTAAELRTRAVPEQQVRDEWDKRPDFTGLSKLPPAEQIRRLSEGLTRSIEVEERLLPEASQ